MEQTIPAMFLEVCNRYVGQTDKAAYSRKIRGEWQSVTHDELKLMVANFAAGLVELGIEPGDRVGIVSENRVEWAVADFAVASIGAIDVPIFPTLTAVQEGFIYSDCQAKCVIVSNQYQLRKIQQAWDNLPNLHYVIVMADDVEVGGRVMHMKAVQELGAKLGEKAMDMLVERSARVAPDALLTIIYTSGTTGQPKGVMLTHRNLTSNIAGAREIITVDKKDIFLSYLPTCHAYERMSGYYLAFQAGVTTFIAESIESVAENMREVRPTVMTSVPRLFERIRSRIIQNVEKEKPFKKKMFYWALEIGARHWQGERGPYMKSQFLLADALVLSKVRARTGGNLRFFVSGGAALQPEVALFFFALGLPILEGYGLTESSPVIAVNLLGEETIGTVGPPLPNVQVRIAEDGEIMAKGPNIMKGYWNDEHATRQAIDSDGWLHTGDIGEFDAKGRLKITDRKKNILVSSGGKNIAPGPIESLLATSPLIDQILLIGEKREYCTALVVLDTEMANQFRAAHPNTSIHDTVEREINRLQKELSKYERVRRFTILTEPFTVENGLLTPTLKVKRKLAEERYATLIEEMYLGANDEE